MGLTVFGGIAPEEKAMNDLSDKHGKLSVSLSYKTNEKQLRIAINIQWKTILSISAAVVLVGIAVVGWLMR